MAKGVPMMSNRAQAKAVRRRAKSNRLVRTACASALMASLLLGGSASAASPDATSIVGRWQQSHRCQQLVDALNALGLGAIAPAMVGDYFPEATPEELAAKTDLCSGARPIQHSHFFTADGMFGSLDQNFNQVDDGTYVMVDSNTFVIGEATFDFTRTGDTLSITPRITAKQRADALKHPLEFSTAGWMVAVSYPGVDWKNVPCFGWC
jgi:hypothetical protein